MDNKEQLEKEKRVKERISKMDEVDIYLFAIKEKYKFVARVNSFGSSGLRCVATKEYFNTKKCKPYLTNLLYRLAELNAVDELEEYSYYRPVRKKMLSILEENLANNKDKAEIMKDCKKYNSELVSHFIECYQNSLKNEEEYDNLDM